MNGSEMIANQKETSQPTEFQSKILQFNFEDFLQWTNVRYIVSDEYIRQNSAVIPSTKLLENALNYFNKLTHLDEWDNCGLKFLKFDGNVEAIEQQMNLKRKMTTPEADDNNMPVTPEKKQKTDTTQNKTKNTKQGTVVEKDSRVMQRRKELLKEPSDFQTEILKLNYEEFVEATNIREIIDREYRYVHPEEESVPENRLNEFLKFYYERRKKTSQWYKCGLKNLKFNICDCRRNRIMKNKKLQTAVIKYSHRSSQCAIESTDAQTQCDLVEPDDWDCLLSNNDERPNTTQTHKETPHKITESFTFNTAIHNFPSNLSKNVNKPINREKTIADNLKLLPYLHSSDGDDNDNGSDDDDLLVIDANTQRSAEIQRDGDERNNRMASNQSEIIRDAFQHANTQNNRPNEEISFDEIERNLQRLEQNETTYCNIKQEAEGFHSQYSNYSQDVQIIDVSPESPINISDEPNTEAFFEEMVQGGRFNYVNHMSTNDYSIIRNPVNHTAQALQSYSMPMAHTISTPANQEPLLNSSFMLLREMDNGSYERYDNLNIVAILNGTQPNANMFVNPSIVQTQNMFINPGIQVQNMAINTPIQAQNIVVNTPFQVQNTQQLSISPTTLTSTQEPTSDTSCMPSSNYGNRNETTAEFFDGTEIGICDAPLIENPIVSLNADAPAKIISERIETQSYVNYGTVTTEKQQKARKKTDKAHFVSVKSSNANIKSKKKPSSPSKQLDKTVVPKFMYPQLTLIQRKKK